MLAAPLSQDSKSCVYSAAGQGVVQLVTFGFYALAFYYGGKLINEGEATFEEFMKVCPCCFLQTQTGQI